jgi:hypothetical protein
MIHDKRIKNVYDKSSRTALKTANFSRELDKFLKSLKATTTFAYNQNPAKKTSPMLKTKSIDKANREVSIGNGKRDLYFYVNGYSKIDEVKSFKTCFVDLDAGRDSRGQYLPASKVAKIKEGFIKKIQSFPLVPTWIVDTRNGYQCYWVLKDNSRRVSRTLWNGLQKKLANHFGGDTLAIKPNQLLRVPFSWWNKAWENKAPYFCSLLVYPESGKNTYTVEELRSHLEGVSTTVKYNYKKCSIQWHLKSNPASYPANLVAELASPNENEVVGYGRSSSNKRAKEKYIQQNLDEVDANNKLLIETIEFLRHTGKTLYYSGNKYLSTQAHNLAERLGSTFCIG